MARMTGLADSYLARAVAGSGVGATAHLPRLAIGLPVYNGEKFLTAAIESYLNQTFADFELTIVDNASTDSTREICEHYVQLDQRLRYLRNAENLGAAPNFNKALQSSRATPYFKWTAADDVYEPTYLAKCVAVLDQDASAVLVHSQARVIDSSGDFLPVIGGPDEAWTSHANDHGTVHWRDVYDLPRRLDSQDAAERFREVILRTRRCMEIWGVMRRGAIFDTHLHESYYGSDKVMLSSLCLAGRFVEIPEALYGRRHHDDSSDSIKSASAREAWMDTSQHKSRVSFARLRCLRGYRRSLAESKLSLRERVNCYGTLTQYLLQWERWGAMLREAR